MNGQGPKDWARDKGTEAGASERNHYLLKRLHCIIREQGCGVGGMPHYVPLMMILWTATTGNGVSQASDLRHSILVL
jgi:hypothetical protein